MARTQPKEKPVVTPKVTPKPVLKTLNVYKQGDLSIEIQQYDTEPEMSLVIYDKDRKVKYSKKFRYIMRYDIKFTNNYLIAIIDNFDKFMTIDLTTFKEVQTKFPELHYSDTGRDLLSIEILDENIIALTYNQNVKIYDSSVQTEYANFLFKQNHKQSGWASPARFKVYVEQLFEVQDDGCIKQQEQGLQWYFIDGNNKYLYTGPNQ